MQDIENSLIVTLLDPPQLLVPLLILMQEVWAAGYDWDEAIRDEFAVNRPTPQRFSNYQRLLHITSWVSRFIA